MFTSGALPNVVVIGAMKAATSALHQYLDAHPDVAMSSLKELNFFNGPERAPHGDADRWWIDGQWHRGVDWYAAQFDAAASVRGESSPAYTSPDFPEVPARMAAVVPEATLLYLVRDPVDRAVSQYAHHRRDGAEPRPVDEALLDPASHYLARSRYFERLEPYLDHFPVGQIHVVVQERLLRDREREIAEVYRRIGVDPTWRGSRHAQRFHVGDRSPPISDELRRAVADAVADDVERLRRFLGDALPEWTAVAGSPQ